jgi:hypothetical protein
VLHRDRKPRRRNEPQNQVKKLDRPETRMLNYSLFF